MKNSVFNLLLSLIMLLSSVTLTAQPDARPILPFEDGSGDEDYGIILDIDKIYPTAGDLALVRISSKNERAFYEIMKEGRNLLDRVLANRGRTDAEESRIIHIELIALEAKLDEQTRQQFGREPLGCNGNCDYDFPGWEKGLEWKRLWCKLSCIKNNFPGGDATGQ